MRKLPGIVIASLALILCSGCQQTPKAPEMFVVKGDLHCHSSFSHDSSVPYEQVIEESITAGYDFISLTEHNTIRHLKDDKSTDKLLIVRGFEATTTAGHVNVFGLSDPTIKSAVFSAEEFNEYLAPMEEKGALTQIDHPNAELYYSKFGYDVRTDCIEILNGVFREDDQKTLDEYQQLLCEGRKIIATGGTDAHRNHTKRGVYNCVLVTELTEQGVLQGLEAGRNYVTVEADGPTISITCGNAVMGASVTRKDGQKINVDIQNLKPGMTVRLYSNAGLYAEQQADATYKTDVPTDTIAFLRAEVWYPDGNIAAYSNPIFVEV